MRFATGRRRHTGQNKTEAGYALVLEARKAAGEVAWYRYEGVKLRLADNTFYTPDFAVMLSDGELQIHEVKGYWEDDARVKIKVAAEQYPLRFFAVTVRPKRDGGGYAFEEI